MEASTAKKSRGITRGMRTFVVVWSGQLVSTIGSGLTGFALGVWIYQETGSVTWFAMNLLAVALPNLVVSPFAGALVDRWDRRWVMIMSDTGAGLATLSIALLYMTDNLAVWNVILATAFNSAFNSFQWPAYSAVTTLLVPKEHLGRAGGMVQIGEAVSQLAAPALAGALFVTTGLGGVIAIDFATYLFAVVTLLFVRVPSPERSEAGMDRRIQCAVTFARALSTTLLHLPQSNPTRSRIQKLRPGVDVLNKTTAERGGAGLRVGIHHPARLHAVVRGVDADGHIIGFEQRL